MTGHANPFEADGVWLRAQLHCHTTNSDGELDPAALAASYAAAGYDVLAVTDHWRITRDAGDHGMVMLSGAELNADLPGPERYCDLIALGIDELPAGAGVRSNNSFPDISAAAEWITGSGGLAFLAHPSWSGVRHHLVTGSRGLTGLETFNATSELDAGRGDSSTLWDETLEDGVALVGVAVDDAHYAPGDLNRAWTSIRARERTPEAVLAALAAGSCYASTGPAIHDARRTGDDVEVRCDPAAAVVLRTRYEYGCGAIGPPRPRTWQAEILSTDSEWFITAARFHPEPDAPYVRVTVTDPRGGSAWTNLL